MSRFQIMGILNVTPDSFSDGGKYVDSALAIKCFDKLLEEGADLIDIGAESTRPGANLIGVESEWERLKPVLEAKASTHGHLISVDTRKADIVERAIELGVRIINDVSAAEDIRVAQALSGQSEARLILNHHRGIPPAKLNQDVSGKTVQEILRFFEGRLKKCLGYGMKMKQFILDPGLGFGKGKEENLMLLRDLKLIKETFGLPVMIGASRKRFVKELWGEENADIGTIAVNLVAIHCGAQIIRTHRVDLAYPLRQLFDSEHE